MKGLEGLSRIHDRIAEDVPSIKRGHVRCKSCGAERHVDGARCLREGWPKCCGKTMELLTGGDDE